MAPKTVKKVLADTLEDLAPENFEKFRHALVDRPGEPKVRRNRVHGKSFLEVTDVLVSTFTEEGAVSVAVEILRGIDLYDEAKKLVEEMSNQPSNTGSSDNEHFVDKHRLQLTNRVSCLAPILDQLLEKGVIQQEAYDTIRKLSTSQAMMRELFSTSLRAGNNCKDIFYEILKENEPYLIKDLQGK